MLVWDFLIVICEDAVGNCADRCFWCPSTSWDGGNIYRLRLLVSRIRRLRALLLANSQYHNPIFLFFLQSTFHLSPVPLPALWSAASDHSLNTLFCKTSPYSNYVIPTPSSSARPSQWWHDVCSSSHWEFAEWPFTIGWPMSLRTLARRLCLFPMIEYWTSLLLLVLFTSLTPPRDSSIFVSAYRRLSSPLGIAVRFGPSSSASPPSPPLWSPCRGTSSHASDCSRSFYLLNWWCQSLCSYSWMRGCGFDSWWVSLLDFNAFLCVLGPSHITWGGGVPAAAALPRPLLRLSSPSY